MKCNHLLEKFEFHVLVAIRRSASKLLMKAPENKNVQSKGRGFLEYEVGQYVEGNCILHLQARICLEMKA
jgi:hypothetical protein